MVKYRISNMEKSKKLILFSLVVVAALSFFVYSNLPAGRQDVLAANVPALKEGTYLIGQTLSTWPSWSLLGNTLGVSLPTDPINQLGVAGTCAINTSRFCIKDSTCETPVTTSSQKCVLHDPVTGWSVTDRRFTFACAADSYAYRYIYSTTTPGAYTVRARFEDPGISPANNSAFVSSFIDTSNFIIGETSGVCNQDQEIATMQSGVCGDGKLNINKGEQCDPPGRIEYENGCVGTIKNLTVCNNSCKWVASTTLCSKFSHCGNGSLELGETCDDGALNGKYNKCNITCTGKNSEKCGDAVLQSAYEVCDPNTSGVEKYSLTSKTDSCSWDCQNWGPYCGDAIVQTNHQEECDGSQACSIDGNPGIKVCTDNCKMSPSATSSANWVCTATTTVATVTAPGTCGDNVINTSENCDRGATNNGKACTPTYGAPCSYCSADCQNTIDVQPAQYCGNGVIESVEKCEVFSNTIYSVAANATSTYPGKDNVRNGYQEKLCSAEFTDPHTIKKGTKSCDVCTSGVVRNCVVCGSKNNGVSVEGGIMNVLDNPIIDQILHRSPDPLYAKITNDSSLSLSVSDRLIGYKCDTGKCVDWLNPASPLVALAVKNNTSADLVSYKLLNPYGAGDALLNSDPICSNDDTFKSKYQMYINKNDSKPLNFTVVAEPQPWQYDLVLSPVVVKASRPKDVRVVVSWVGSGDFYSGVLNPFITNPDVEGPAQIEGPAYVVPCSGIGCIFSHKYANGVTYYNSAADFKKTGVWYHGFNSTPGQTSEEAFTIDTSAMSGNTYSFYVRAPSFPIRTFKISAKLKVDVFLPEKDTDQYHFGTPVKTYYLQSAAPSDNQNARYWQVFNLNAPTANVTTSDIIDINTIITGGSVDNFIYTKPRMANAPCTEEDWTSSAPSPTICPLAAPHEQTVTWSRKVTANCIGGVTHSATQIVSCECAEADWTYTVSPLTCPESGRKTKVWGGKKSTSNCEGGFFPPPDSETVNCTYLGGSTGGIYAPPDTATCTDNIQNGAETAVDCGGSCPACGGSKYAYN
ncbi:MAG: hypothetical protein UT67_C0008G0002 [Candidatus Magasanikbacteria bacterium GW2011_GWA2_40_10]|uniref:Uncharacterized protein n=1 Tax=Candidatus Magasanikbacteria bacterium GW2011_GWA2_40_10 TaxID=1619037 RepID=A0A0G0Q3N0_9BACT|nr:MAG: hypothetical protein UT67_C0008G0002 [Candidatus Magasanikbacteria bacterium GW2011_GWA2_40_10]